jgi:Ca2+-binding RTX toxin-like protein
MALFSRQTGRARTSARRWRPGVEALEGRAVPAVQAFFSAGTLTVLGDGAANNILVGADSAGQIQVTNNGGAVSVRSPFGPATLAQTTEIHIEGRGGDDVLTTDGSLNQLINQGQVPHVTVLGGAGNDTLQVNSGGIVGGLAGIDLTTGTVTGQVVGNAYMDGGAGNDTLVSGFGNDTILGGTGDDTYLWPPGTLTDIFDGGAGNDTAIIVGNDTLLGQVANDNFRLTGNGDRVRFDRTNLVKFSVDIGTTENIILRPGAGDDTVVIQDLTGVRNLRSVQVEGAAGNDTIDGSAQSNARISLTLLGGDGNDLLKGGAGADTLSGDAGDDFLYGGGGRDVLFGGDGKDVLDGQGGQDTIIGGTGKDSFANSTNDLVLDFNVCERDVLVNPFGVAKKR